MRSTLVRLGGAQARAVAAAAFACFVAGCGVTLDAGATRPHGLLPVDERNPILLLNDGASDNWQGEYAVVLANDAGPKLAGIIVNASGPWPDLAANVASWRSFVSAARESGLSGVPDPIGSSSSPLVRPASGELADTPPNRSEGARAILSAAAQLSLPYRPLAVVTGGRLTDVADAYLMDPTIVNRVVVVSSLGTMSASGGAMGNPNGEMDPWADAIVSARFRYVQVSAYYDQLTDVPASRIPELPANAFGFWIAAKQPSIFDLDVAADQVGVLAVALRSFAVTVERVSPTGFDSVSASAGPDLLLAEGGRGWLVTHSDGAAATARFWDALRNPATFGR